MLREWSQTQTSSPSRETPDEIHLKKQEVVSQLPKAGKEEQGATTSGHRVFGGDEIFSLRGDDGTTP